MTTNPHVPPAEVKVGTPLRDAAVDPRPEDFLPPTNAGKADPHGPLVVAPEIHASGTQPVRPGPVHVDDVKAQERAETEQAVKLLVEQRDVGDVIPTADGSLGSRGPLGLSDPGSVPGGLAKAAAEESAGTAALFDPADHTVDEVNSYLETTDDTEHARVIDAETAGKARKGILGG